MMFHSSFLPDSTASITDASGIAHKDVTIQSHENLGPQESTGLNTCLVMACLFAIACYFAILTGMMIMISIDSCFCEGTGPRSLEQTAWQSTMASSQRTTQLSSHGEAHQRLSGCGRDHHRGHQVLEMGELVREPNTDCQITFLGMRWAQCFP